MYKNKFVLLQTKKVIMEGKETYGLTDRSYNELMMILDSFPEIEEVII